MRRVQQGCTSECSRAAGLPSPDSTRLPPTRTGLDPGLAVVRESSALARLAGFLIAFGTVIEHLAGSPRQCVQRIDRNYRHGLPAGAARRPVRSAPTASARLLPDQSQPYSAVSLRCARAVDRSPLTSTKLQVINRTPSAGHLGSEGLPLTPTAVGAPGRSGAAAVAGARRSG